MAIKVQCSDPSSLLTDIRSKVREGALHHWAVDSDGDFTLTSDDTPRAWLRPKIAEGELAFFILGTRSKGVTRVAYGTYHGRFIEMLLNNFDDRFWRAYASALPEPGDAVSPAK